MFESNYCRIESQNSVGIDFFAGTGTFAEAVEILNIHGNKEPSKDQVKAIKKGIRSGQRPLAYPNSRNWILVDLNPNYCKIAEQKLNPYLKLRQAL